MNHHHVKTVAIKEFRTYLNAPTSYIIIIVFLLLWEFLFFRHAFLFAEASLRLLLSFVPWLFILFIPALTMGSISEEKSRGTLEILLTHPLGILELILGKFIAAAGFVAFTLAFMLPVAYSLDRYGNIDWGVVTGQYFASVLLGSVFISLGLFISSLFTSQIASLLVSSAISFLLIISGFEIITLSLPPQIATIFERLSILTHFDSMSRGVIDLRDLWYFGSAIVIFISLASLQVLKIRHGNQKAVYRRLQLGTALFVAIAVMLNIVGTRIPGRLDLTQNRDYQLSDATKQTLQSLDDVVNIQLFASAALPTQLSPILRDIKDLLHDYQTYSNDQITLAVKDPASDPAIRSQATNLGIREVQFNVVDQDELQLKRGYLGLTVSYGGQSETIPLISDTSDLEYQLTSFIKKLTSADRQTIAFLTGHGEKSPTLNYSLLTQELEKLYQIQELNLEKTLEEAPSSTPFANISALVIAGPTSPIESPERQLIANYIDQGGSALFLLDGVTVNQSLLSATVNNHNLADFVATFGIQLSQDLVYDLRSNEMVNFGAGPGMTYLLRYPFWPRAQATNATSPITGKIRSLVLPWPSSIQFLPEILEQRGWTATNLFATSEAGGIQTSNFNIRPDQQLLTTDLSVHSLAVSLIDQQSNPEASSRIVVIGESDFLTDDFVTSSAENLAFGLSSLNWLTQEESLAQLQLKRRQANPLIFQDETQPQIVKYANLVLAFSIPFIFGVSHLLKRRNLKKFKYAS